MSIEKYMKAPTLLNFTSTLRKRNISKPSLYYVEIIPPTKMRENKSYTGDSNMVSMWCHAASTPQNTISTNDNYIEAGVKRKYAYDQDYANLVLQFYIDQSFEVKKFFDDWKQMIVPHRRTFGYPSDYTANSLNLFMIDETGNATYKYEYSNVVPKTIQSVEMSYATGNATSTFSVEFVFEEVYYSSIVDGSVKFTSKPN